MPGERRLTSIKALIESVTLMLAPIGGTITIDEITNTVTVQLVEPVTIDGTLNIASLPAIVASITSLPNVTIADIINLNVDSLPTVIISHAVGNLTYTHGVVSVTAADTLIVPANANRKFVSLRRGTTVGRVFCKFGATAATTINGFLMRENQFTKFEKEYVDTREIRGIAVGSSKIIYWSEAT